MDEPELIQQPGAGFVNLQKAVSPTGQPVMVFQIYMQNGIPLAYLDLQKSEALQLIDHLRSAINTIWAEEN